VAALVSHGSQHVHVTCQPASRHPGCPWLLRVVCVRRLCVFANHTVLARSIRPPMPSHTHTRWLACCTALHHRGHSSVTSPHVFSHLITLVACCFRRNARHTFTSLPLLARHVKATHTTTTHVTTSLSCTPSQPLPSLLTQRARSAHVLQSMHRATCMCITHVPTFHFLNLPSRSSDVVYGLAQVARSLPPSARPHKRPLSPSVCTCEMTHC
jgi:hypothetical protein